MKKIFKWLDLHGEAAAIGIMVAAMAILMMIQVVLRYCFHTGIRWVEEVVIYLNVWCGFIGISYCVRYNNDMRIDASSILPKSVAKLLKTVSDFVLFLFYIYLFKTGLVVVKNLMATGQRSPAAQIPMSVVYAAVMVGCLLASFRFIQRVVRWFLMRKKEKGAAE